MKLLSPTFLAPLAGSLFLVLTVLTGCSSDAADDGEDSVEQNASLLQGGCSMAEIRGWQRDCRANFGGRGINYCYPGMSLRHMSCEGACAC